MVEGSLEGSLLLWRRWEHEPAGPQRCGRTLEGAEKDRSPAMNKARLRAWPPRRGRCRRKRGTPSETLLHRSLHRCCTKHCSSCSTCMPGSRKQSETLKERQRVNEQRLTVPRRPLKDCSHPNVLGGNAGPFGPRRDQTSARCKTRVFYCCGAFP